MTNSCITKMEASIGLPLPDALRELYDRFDGEIFSDRPMRLMRSDKVVAEWESLRRVARLRGSCPFWVSRNHDYAAIYLEGPLLGRIFLWSQDSAEVNESVAYRSVPSFLESLEAAANDDLDWCELPTDYYVDTDYYINGAAESKAAGPTDIESDRKAIEQLRSEYATATIEDEFDDLYFAFNIMGLTPLSETDSITAFLNSGEMDIQARACKILGHRRFAPAIERLGHLARHAIGNGKSAALAALGKIGTPDALEEIVESIPHFSKGSHLWVAKALEGCGCRVRSEEDKFRTRHYEYQFPNTDHWHKLE